MVNEQIIANTKTGEELSLSITDDGYEEEDGESFCCVIEIKRKRIVSKAIEKNAK